MAERIKPVILTDTDTGEKYTLEFSRDTVRWAESRGFSIDDVERFPMTKGYEFFFYSFRMHHRNVPREKTDKMIDDGWGGIGNVPSALFERLIESYASTFGTLLDEEQENENPRMVVEL